MRHFIQVHNTASEAYILDVRHGLRERETKLIKTDHIVLVETAK
jgi:hypothetical protein